MPSELKLPKTVVAYAFDILPPQTKEFLDALGIEVVFTKPGSKVWLRLNRLDGSGTSSTAAARWASARLEGGAARIGVVVPGLAERKEEVGRALARDAAEGEKLAMPFNVSLGTPLGYFQ